MVLLSGYFDASGNGETREEKKALTVGGFVSDAYKWGQFDGEWGDALKRQGLSEFRMTDLMAGKKAFATFRDRPDRQSALLLKLARIVRKHVRKRFATTVFVDDWRAVNHAHRLRECRFSPYSLAAFSVTNKAMSFIAARKPKRKRKDRYEFEPFIFEKGDAGQDDYQWLMKEICKNEPSLARVEPIFRDKSYRQLQCADLAVWGDRAYFEAFFQRSAAPFGEWLAELREIPGGEKRVIDREKILEYVEWLGVPNRQEVWNRRTWRPRFFHQTH